MSKCYCFDLFYGSYRTRYEIESPRLSQAIDVLTGYFEGMREYGYNIRVCGRYIVQTLNSNGEPVSARYNTLRNEYSFVVEPYSKNIYDSTIFVPFINFGDLCDDEKETRPENLLPGGSWYVNDH